MDNRVVLFKINGEWVKKRRYANMKPGMTRNEHTVRSVSIQIMENIYDYYNIVKSPEERMDYANMLTYALWHETEKDVTIVLTSIFEDNEIIPNAEVMEGINDMIQQAFQYIIKN